MEHKKYCTFRDPCCYAEEYSGVGHSMCNLKYSVPKRIPIAFHDASNMIGAPTLTRRVL